MYTFRALSNILSSIADEKSRGDMDGFTCEHSHRLEALQLVTVVVNITELDV